MNNWRHGTRRESRRESKHCLIDCPSAIWARSKHCTALARCARVVGRHAKRGRFSHHGDDPRRHTIWKVPCAREKFSIQHDNITLCSELFRSGSLFDVILPVQLCVHVTQGILRLSIDHRCEESTMLIESRRLMWKSTRAHPRGLYGPITAGFVGCTDELRSPDFE